MPVRFDRRWLSVPWPRSDILGPGRHRRSRRSRPSVCVVAVNYAPESSGIGPVVTELAEFLHARHGETEVLTTYPHYPAWRLLPEHRRRIGGTEVIGGLRVHRRRCFIPRRPSVLRRIAFEVSFFIAAVGRAVRTDPEVYVGLSPGLSSGAVAVVAGRLRRRPSVLVFQDLAGRGISQSGLSSLRWIGSIVAGFEAILARSATRTIVISESFVAPLVNERVDPENVVVLPNWIKGDMPEVSAEDIASMRRRFAAIDDCLIVHAGTLSLKQGLDQIVAAAESARSSHPRLRFVLIGDGAERRRLERDAAHLPNVLFVDPLPNESFSAALRAADVLLVCQNEANVDMSFPSKLTSYLEAGRPIVALVPPEGSVASFLECSDAGISVPAGDVVAALRGIEVALTSEAITRCSRGASLARSGLRADAVLPRWAAAIDAVVGTRR